MKEYLALRLVRATDALLSAYVELSNASDEALTPERRKDIQNCVMAFVSESEFLALPITTKAAKRLAASALHKNSTELEVEHREVDSRFKDEAEALSLFYIHGDALRYYNKPDLFGEEFKARFPTANAEIIEAGNCFAFDRFTSCAYHLSRAIEIALRTLFLSLGLPPRIWSVTKWKGITDRIGGKIQNNNLRLASDPGWQADRSFYEKAHAFLESARNPIRNFTMHVDVTYPDEGSVRPVWLATEAFMRHLATKLKE